MILTRSIRRKLAIVLVVVFLMVLLLSVAGLSALFAYRSVVNNLKVSSQKEQLHDNLTSAIHGLVDTVLHRQNIKNSNPWATASIELQHYFDIQAWKIQRAVVDGEFSQFYASRTEDNRVLQQSYSQLNLDLINAQLKHIDHRIRQFESSDDQDHVEFARELGPKVMYLQKLVHEIRLPGRAADNTLRDSGKTFNRLLWMIGVPSLIVVVLFGFLISCCYHWILIPIRQLHEAASRVANGDFSYRLKLQCRDEMAELAEMFNKMTARFQTDKGRLALEVEERSRQILRNERLAGIGFFASGIAHEINNPLQAIANAAESLTGRLADDSFGPELRRDDRELLTTYLTMIERESTRCQQITARVLDFARGTNGPKTRQDLTRIVNEVLDMVSHMSKFDGCKIEFDRTQQHLVDVSSEIKQVVLNLVANGLESMNGSGKMTVQITETVEEIVLSIQDQGCGMTASVIENLYEPFFTEKQNGKGTGLGLSITHRIVTDHGGRIEATSEGPGCGSTFRVHLPRCANAVKSSAA